MSNLDVNVGRSRSSNQAAEVKASPSMEQASAYLSLPEVSSRSHSVDVKSDLRSPQELLIKLRDQEEVVGGTTAEKRLVDGSTLVLLGELRPLEERLRQQQDTNNSNWQELETKLIYLRQGISTQLSRILNEYEQGNEPSAELLKDVAKELEVLRKETRLVEESSRGERESTQMDKGFDRDKILTSLGYDVASLNEDEKSELEFKLALGREEVGIELEKAQAVLSEAEEKRQREIEYLTKETGETEGHFFGFLYGEYDLGNEGMKMNLERLTKAQSEVMQAQQGLASVQAEADKLDIALSGFQAERSWSEGRYEEAHRSILRVMESSQREMVLGESKNLVLAEAVSTSYRILSEAGRLSEREEVLYSEKEGGRELFRSTIDYHRETTKGEAGVDIDARDQVLSRSSWIVEEESKVSEKFKAVTLNYNNRPHKELNDLEFVGLRSGSGVRYDLVLTKEAKTALENIPEGAVPVFLKPVKSMQTNYAGGRQRSVILANAPSDFRVDNYQIGYELNGKFYQSGGAEIDLSKHPHADWIRGQVSRASSFKVSEFSAGNSVDLKKFNVGTGKLEKYNDKLHTLETESGEKIEGLKLDKEVLELIKKVPPEGYTLVLKNKPESLMLGALDRENYSVGRGVRLNQSRRIIGKVPELGVEDFEYAKVGEDKLERISIDQTPIKESNLTGIRQLDQTATRDIQRALANDEDVKWLRSGALSTNRTLSNLQGFLNANQEGSSREAFIEFARNEAKPLEEFLTSGDTKERIERLEEKLSELKKLSKGVAGSEYEREILDQIKALESFMAVVKDPSTLEVVKTIGDASKFGEDSWNRWASTELPIIAGSVAGAVAASAVVVASAGTLAPVVVPLWVTAAAGAVGGVIGGELAQEGLHFYETSYGGASRGEYTWNRRSLLAQVGDKTFNHETGKYEEITLGNVSLEYGKQVATNFVFSYSSMLGSQALSAKFTEILTKSKLVDKVMENSTTGKLLARYLGSKTASNMSQAERLTIEKAFKEAGKQIASELPDEFSDELLEDWTVKLIDKVGQNLSKAGVNFGQDHLAGLIVGTVKGTRVSSRSFAYDNSNIASGKQAEGLTELINQARESGYVVTNLGKGHYTFADTINGERYTVRPKTDEDTAVFSAPQLDIMLQMKRQEAAVSGPAQGEEIKELVLPKVDLASVREEFEFKETGRVTTTHDNVQVPTQYLVIAGREYEGYLRKNEKVFYLVNESEIPDLYADILKIRAQIDENGSYDVNSFIDKETGLIFTAMPRPNETPAETEDRVKNSTHENQHRTDLVAGRELDERRAYDRASRYASDPASATFDESRYQGAENLSLAASRRNDGFNSPNEQQRPTVESLEKQFDELINNGRHPQAGPWIPYFLNLSRRNEVSETDYAANLLLRNQMERFVDYNRDTEGRVIEVQANSAKRILTDLYTKVDSQLAESHWEQVKLKRELAEIRFHQINKWAEISGKLESVGRDMERLDTLRNAVSKLIDPRYDFITFGKKEILQYGGNEGVFYGVHQSKNLAATILAENKEHSSIEDYWLAQYESEYNKLRKGEFNPVSESVIEYAATERKNQIVVSSELPGFYVRGPSESGYRRQDFLIGKKDRFALNVELSTELIDQLDNFALKYGVDYKIPKEVDHAASRIDVVNVYVKAPLTKEAEVELAKIARDHARSGGVLHGDPVLENGVELSENIKRSKDITAHEVDLLVAKAFTIDPSLAAFIKNESINSRRGIVSPGSYQAYLNIIRSHHEKYVEGKVEKNVSPTFKPWLLEMEVGESKVIGRNDLRYFASPPPGEVSSQHVIITRNRDLGGQPSFIIEDRSLNGTTIKYPNGVIRKLGNGQRMILDPGAKVLLYRHELPLVERASGNVPSPFERQRNLAQLVKPSSESEVNDWKEGRVRGAESRQLKDAKTNYFPSREALETEFVRQERVAAQEAGEVFDENDSRKRAQATYGFFSRLDNQIYVLTPETLQDGATGPDRSTRILQAMAVIHELTQKRLEDVSPAVNAQEELDQEIAVWKECAVYLKSRGYEFQFTEGGWKIVETKSEKEANDRVVDLKAEGRKITLTLEEEKNIQEGVERLYAGNGSEIDRARIPSRALSQMKGESDSSSVDENTITPEMETVAGGDVLKKNLWKLENGSSLTDNEILDLLIDIDQDPLRYDAKAKGLLYEALKREGYDDIESLCSNISMEVLSEAREDYYTDLFKQFRTSSNNLTHVERMRLYERMEEFGLDGILSQDRLTLLQNSKELIEQVGLFNYSSKGFSDEKVVEMMMTLSQSGELFLFKDGEKVNRFLDSYVLNSLIQHEDGSHKFSHKQLMQIAKLAEMREAELGNIVTDYSNFVEHILEVERLIATLATGNNISNSELLIVAEYSKKLDSNIELLKFVGPLHPQYLQLEGLIQGEEIQLEMEVELQAELIQPTTSRDNALATSSLSPRQKVIAQLVRDGLNELAVMEEVNILGGKISSSSDLRESKLVEIVEQLDLSQSYKGKIEALSDLGKMVRLGIVDLSKDVNEDDASSEILETFESLDEISSAISLMILKLKAAERLSVPRNPLVESTPADSRIVIDHLDLGSSSTIDFTSLSSRINQGEVLTDSEIDEYASTVVELNDGVSLQAIVPDTHPQKNQIDREISIYSLSQAVNYSDANIRYDTLERIVEGVSSETGMKNSEVAKALYYLTRYTELGGRRANSLYLSNQYQDSNDSRLLYDVPIDGLLSLQTALGDAGLIRFGMSNGSRSLYLPKVGSVADQLAYLLNNRMMGGTGVGENKQTYALKDVTNTITKDSLVIVDSIILSKIKNDASFRASIIANKPQLVFVPELIGGIKMGSVNNGNLEHEIRLKLINTINAYQSKLEKGSTIPLNILDEDNLREVMLGSSVEDVKQMLNLDADYDSSFISVLDLSSFTAQGISDVQFQLNGRPRPYDSLAMADVLRDSLEALELNLTDREQTLLFNAMNQSVKLYGTREISEKLISLNDAINTEVTELANRINSQKPPSIDLYYVVPRSEKSYQYVAGLFRSANGISDDRFITPEEVVSQRRSSKERGKLFVPVVIDDFAATGNSLLKVGVSATDGSSLPDNVSARDVKIYAKKRREKEPFTKNDSKLLERLFGVERASRKEFPDPSQTNDRPIILATILSTSWGRKSIEQNQLSKLSVFVSADEALAIQETSAWKELISLPEMTQARRVQIERSLELSSPSYDTEGRMTLVQFPHGDSNTNMHWWQRFIEPHLAVAVKSIREYFGRHETVRARYSK